MECDSHRTATIRESAASDPGVTAIVVMGAGRTFIAGADIREFVTPGTQGIHRLIDGDDGNLLVTGKSNGVAHVATQSSDPPAGVSNGKFHS
jgi:enoyl-CoA hydratase/carnithine racemase